MEIDLLALVEQDGFRSCRESTSRGGQLNGPCPFCGGTDRFRVQPAHGQYGWFACSQCERRGSAVDYLVMKRGLSKVEALHAVGWTPQDGSQLEARIPKEAQDERPQWEEPPEIWQDAARDFCRECYRVLWTDAGIEARAYLLRRGFDSKTIEAARLGYHLRETYGSAHEWGRVVKLAQGIVIPWFIGRSLWRITIRNARVGTGDGRYKQVGGGSNGLYLADSLKLKRPTVVMVEGEFDALSLAQECGDEIAVVAAGTTGGSHTPRWLAALSSAPRVLVAFDAEEKGDKAAGWWLERLSNAVRLRPWWKDANQMLQDGAALRAWVSQGRGLTQNGSPGGAEAFDTLGVEKGAVHLQTLEVQTDPDVSHRFEAQHQTPADLQSENFGVQTQPCDHHQFDDGCEIAQAESVDVNLMPTPEQQDEERRIPYWYELDQSIVDEMEREYERERGFIKRYHLQETFIPCPKCGCGVYRDLEGQIVCCRCYPPKGYHQYSALVDQLYPRKRSL